MPKYVPRLEGMMHDPEGSALCLLTLGHILDPISNLVNSGTPDVLIGKDEKTNEIFNVPLASTEGEITWFNSLLVFFNSGEII